MPGDQPIPTVGVGAQGALPEGRTVAIVVVLVPADSGGDGLVATNLRRLGELGVTNVAVVRDDTTVGVVLEGWAFDPARSGREAASLVGGYASHTLLPVLQGAVTPPMHEQETEPTRTSAGQRKEQS